MPTIADIIDPTSYEVLEAERLANLERIAADHAASLLELPGVAEALTPAEELAEVIAENNYAAIVGDLDAQDAEDEAMLPQSVRRAGIRPRSERNTETEEVTVPERGSSHNINLSHLSDAQLGRMVRAALLTLVVDELPAQLAEVLGQREQATTASNALAKAEMDERQAHPELWVLPAFTIGEKEIPELDLRDVIMGELAPAKARSRYNPTLYKLGLPTLKHDEATWEVVRDTHIALSLQEIANRPAPTALVIVAEVDQDRKAKVAALAEVLGISKKAAAKRMKEINA